MNAKLTHRECRCEYTRLQILVCIQYACYTLKPAIHYARVTYRLSNLPALAVIERIVIHVSQANQPVYTMHDVLDLFNSRIDSLNTCIMYSQLYYTCESNGLNQFQFIVNAEVHFTFTRDKLPEFDNAHYFFRISQLQVYHPFSTSHHAEESGQRSSSISQSAQNNVLCVYYAKTKRMSFWEENESKEYKYLKKMVGGVLNYFSIHRKQQKLTYNFMRVCVDFNVHSNVG